MLLLLWEWRWFVVSSHSDTTHLNFLAAGALAAAADHTHPSTLIATAYTAAAAAAHASCLWWHLGAWSFILSEITTTIVIL